MFSKDICIWERVKEYLILSYSNHLVKQSRVIYWFKKFHFLKKSCAADRISLNNFGWGTNIFWNWASGLQEDLSFLKLWWPSCALERNGLNNASAFGKELRINYNTCGVWSSSSLQIGGTSFDNWRHLAPYLEEATRTKHVI